MKQSTTYRSGSTSPEDKTLEAHIAYWSAEHRDPNIVPLPDKCIDELDKLAPQIHSSIREPAHQLISSILNSDSSANLIECRQFALELRDCLDNGIGHLVIDRIPVDRYSAETSKLLSAILSSLISPLLAQDINGTLLYDVLDTGHSDDGKVRRSKTNVEQPFHTDGPWLQQPPKFIGLFCIQPSVSGGESRVASLLWAVNQYINTVGEIDIGSNLSWNKMSEHLPTEDPYSKLPICSIEQNGTLLRHYKDYVKTGYELSEEEFPEQESRCLEFIETCMNRHASKPFRLEAGQMQYVNNWTVTHARGGFESLGPRHLVRLWNSGASAISTAKTEEAQQDKLLEPA